MIGSHDVSEQLMLEVKSAALEKEARVCPSTKVPKRTLLGVGVGKSHLAPNAPIPELENAEGDTCKGEKRKGRFSMMATAKAVALTRLESAALVDCCASATLMG